MLVTRFSFLIACIFIFSEAFSQQPGFSLSGKLISKKGKTPVKDASIGLIQKADKKTVYYFPDAGGNFIIPQVSDSIILFITSIGFKPYRNQLFIDKNSVLTIVLEENISELKPVEISGGTEKNSRDARVSVETISALKAKELPVIAGETDIIKSLQLRPGIKSGVEGSSSLLVRGGSPDQNLILLDDAVIYNPNHIFGFLSVFNNDLLKEVSVYKGAFPASYGGRLSAIVDVSTISGNKDSLKVKGGIGIISSRIMLEGPLVKGKTSFVIAARRSYFDLFSQQYNKYKNGDANFDPLPLYYLYDLNLKINHILNKNNYLSLSAYYGADKYAILKNDRNIEFNWGNRSISLKWLHIFNEKLSLSTTLANSGFKNTITSEDAVTALELNTAITDYTFKSNLNWTASSFSDIKMGLFYTVNEYAITKLANKNISGSGSLIAGENLRSVHYGAYILDEISVSEKIKIQPGIRMSLYRKDSGFFHSLEPRIALHYIIREDFSCKAAYARMYQYLHLISNPGVSLPTDIWYPSGENVSPQYGDQVTVGFIKTFYNGRIVVNNEYYKKWLYNQIEFRDGAQIIVNKNYRDLFVFGTGTAYGAELSIEKPKGKINGWISYTIGQNWRTFNDINNGVPFHPNFDRRHDLSIVALYHISKRFVCAATWVYATGNYVSVPVARYLALDVNSVSNVQSVPIYLERNGYRMNDYHRLDLSLTYKLAPKRGEADITLSVYNAYNRMNPYYIYLEDVRDKNNNILYFQAKQVSLFPIIPAITYNFKF